MYGAEEESISEWLTDNSHSGNSSKSQTLTSDNLLAVALGERAVEMVSGQSFSSSHNGKQQQQLSVVREEASAGESGPDQDESGREVGATTAVTNGNATVRKRA